MSFVSTFVESHLIPIMEEQLVNHEPEIQAELLKELQAMSALISDWVLKKLEPKS